MMDSSALRRLLAGSVLALAIAGVMPAAVAIAQDAPAAEQAGPKFDDVVKGLRKVTSVDGPSLMTLYVGENNSKEAGKLLAAIPPSLIGKDLLLATSISRGPFMGYPAGSDLVRWQQIGNSLVLTLPDIRQKQNPSKAINEAVGATYTSSFLAALPIITKTPAGEMVVDLSQMVVSTGGNLFGGMGLQPRPDLTTYAKVKAFPENILIDTDIAMGQRGGAGSTVGVGISLRLLPTIGTSNFKPRHADERVGYFQTIRQDWTTPYSDRETIVRYANRWNLQKKDPTLDVSPPEKPIVFIIEKTVPLQWRRFVADGILEWNKAFEQVGITGAIVVQQQTDDNEFANIDPEDARYNFFRWIVTGQGFAMGPSRPDPRTGEILDADIIFDDSMVRFYQQDLRNVLGADALGWQIGPEVIEFLEKNPQFIPMGVTLEDVRKTADQMRTHAEMASGNRELLMDEHALLNQPQSKPLYHPSACTYADGMRHQMSVLNLVVAAGGERKVPERLIGQIIKDITAHEVGHTLGLRHNFKSSAWLSPDEIKKRRDANDGTALFGSVMDYNALSLFPGDKIEEVKQITSPTVGPYDMWAIEWGYQFFDKEKEGLAKLVARNNEPGLAYSTDEDVAGLSSPDPLSNRWDMSSDPIAWAQLQSKLADEMLVNFDKWAVDSDEPSHFLRGAFLTLMFDKTRNASYVSRLIGGQYFNRNRASDTNAVAPLVLVPADTQRKALDELAKTVFNDEFLKVDPELLNRLPVSRDSDGENWPTARIDFPVHQTMLRLQSGALLSIMNPVTIQRVYDAELKSTADNKFTAAELLTKTRDAIWSLPKGDVEFTDAKPAISSTRRNLQKQWLQNMISLAKMDNNAMLSADVSSMARQVLRDLSSEIELSMKAHAKDKGSKLDFASRAHLTETKSRIDRTLDSQEVDVNVEMPFFMFGREAGKQK
jgi:hypothetical protein